MKMVKASDLRIGNYIYSYLSEEKDGIFTVDIIYLTKIYDLPKVVEPIPLTEEWLIKFSFNRLEWGWELNNFTIYVRDNKSDGNIYTVEVGGKEYDIKHVHQLQNAFALTGEELTIKEI